MLCQVYRCICRSMCTQNRGENCMQRTGGNFHLPAPANGSQNVVHLLDDCLVCLRVRCACSPVNGARACGSETNSSADTLGYKCNQHTALRSSGSLLRKEVFRWTREAH